MTHVIAQPSGAHYRERMFAALLRIMLLMALTIMPFGMGASPAIAETTAWTAGHCGEQRGPAEMPVTAKVHCMACAALPVLDAPPAYAQMAPDSPEPLQPAALVSEQEPETATPPPKLA